jgi:hypothetical protein
MESPKSSEVKKTDWSKILSNVSLNVKSDKVYVHPHRRKDGTYVKGHWRKKPK